MYKVPFLVALYVVKSLLDQGIQFKKRVRFIFGTDEETLWRCMARYNAIEEQASMGFAPDSSFPLTYDKKELFQFKLHGIGSEQLALDIGCQTVSRFVPFPRKRANRIPCK